MSKFNIEQLREYISKHNKYQFKEPISAKLKGKEMVKIKEGKKTITVEKDVLIPCRVIFCSISHDTDAPNLPKLLFLVDVNGSLSYKNENNLVFNNY